MNRRHSPLCEPLPVRALPSAGWAPPVILYDLDTGSSGLAWTADDPKYNIPAPSGAGYLAPEIDFRGPVPSFPGAVDYSGYGGHGSVMAELYAATVIGAGQVPIVVPCVVGDASDFQSDAIGRAELTIAAEAHAHPELRILVALPAGPGFISSSESRGRLALASAGVPLVESAGDRGIPVDSSQFGPGTTVVSALSPNGTRPFYSSFGAGIVPVKIPDPVLGTSGAAEVEAARIALGLAPPSPVALAHPGRVARGALNR